MTRKWSEIRGSRPVTPEQEAANERGERDLAEQLADWNTLMDRGGESNR